MFFQNDPVFALAPDAAREEHQVDRLVRRERRCAAAGRGASRISTRACEIVSSKVGKGRVFLFAPEVLFRSQPHGGFKLFFNGLYLSVAEGLE